MLGKIYPESISTYIRFVEIRLTEDAWKRTSGEIVRAKINEVLAHYGKVLDTHVGNPVDFSGARTEPVFDPKTKLSQILYYPIESL